MGGRGRQGRVWVSPPGNLHASTLVRLRTGDPPAPTLALVAAVALHETLSLYAGGVSIKWPNDLVAGGAKLAGILLERADDSVVIGFGVNVAHHPHDLDRAATSIAALAGAAPEPGDLHQTLSDAFERWLGRWRSEGLVAVRTAWLAAAHPVGTRLAAAGEQGVFDGLEETGALRLRLADGSLRTVNAGDVFLI